MSDHTLMRRLQQAVSVAQSNGVAVRGGYEITTPNGDHFEVHITRFEQ